MISLYLRSSSYNTYSLCEQQYFIEYVLGHKAPAGKAASKGTMTHKCLEILALSKKAIQDGLNQFEDEELGEICFEDINSNEYVDSIISKTWNFYKDKMGIEWVKKDEKDIYKWTWEAITYNNGCFDPRKKEIFWPEFQFDITFPHKWAEYYFINPIDDCILYGQLALKGTIDLITKVNNDTYEVTDYKGLPLDTPIPTVDGWKTMSELQVGDKVFDQYGKQTKIIGKSRVKNVECYKIIFDDKSEVICDKEHQWKLHDGKTVKVTELKVKDLIKIASPIDMPKIDLPIDPYTLGIWLGDGRNRGGSVSGADIFIFEEIARRGYPVGHDISCKEGICEERTIFNLTKQLRPLNLLHNKHIPPIYFRASFEQRLDLLRGLMDSDGCVNCFREQGMFFNCHKRLSEDVLELLHTLGQRPKLFKTKKTGFGLTVDSYDIYFRPININPFLLPRKADRVSKDWGSGKSWRRQVREIIPMGEQKTQCIMVDSPDSTYLCTKNMIPTHNSGRRLDWATNEEKDYTYLCDDPQLRIYHYALSKTFPHIKHWILTIYFINDGGPFTMSYGEEDIVKTEEMIKKRFEHIKQNTRPSLIKDKSQSWKCSKVCHFGKNYHPKNPSKTICQFINENVRINGIDHTIKNYSKDGHQFGNYQQPGRY